MTARRRCAFSATSCCRWSKTNLAALFVITFIYGWNQYLWPLLIITDVNLGTAVAGYQRDDRHRRRYHAMEPGDGGNAADPYSPVVIVLAMQRAFVRGLVDSEK
ncbi:sn-Glycerol-3-phosphate transporter permease [Salmonella enterica subsp. enterica]|nr:sn-Glycerol-3-phosphate transporter permease [Salmonella enterica subsp. enterica]